MPRCNLFGREQARADRREQRAGLEFVDGLDGAARGLAGARGCTGGRATVAGGGLAGERRRGRMARAHGRIVSVFPPVAGDQPSTEWGWGRGRPARGKAQLATTTLTTGLDLPAKPCPATPRPSAPVPCRVPLYF